MAGTADYGPLKFGRYPGDPQSFTGRCVGLLGRSLEVPLDADPATALHDYLAAARTASAKALAAKAVILLHREQLAGKSSGSPALHADMLICRISDVSASTMWPSRGRVLPRGGPRPSDLQRAPAYPVTPDRPKVSLEVMNIDGRTLCEREARGECRAVPRIGAVPVASLFLSFGGHNRCSGFRYSSRFQSGYCL
jgi:hypothetical protein